MIIPLCTQSVYLGGLAALQDECDIDNPNQLVNVGTVGIARGLPCSKVYRFHWFIMR